VEIRTKRTGGEAAGAVRADLLIVKRMAELFAETGGSRYMRGPMP
jgi:hypothetical protein